MFSEATALTKSPQIKLRTTSQSCCHAMFYYCPALETLSKLLPLGLDLYCYAYMYYNCGKIKLSFLETGEYVNEYKIPYSGNSGYVSTGAVDTMFGGTGGTYTGDPIVGQTYYTSNEVV